MESRLRPEQAYQVRQQCFSKFEELIGFYPKTLKQRILALLTYDYDWGSMFNMVLVLNGATSIDQRINEMIREGKVEFDQKHEGSNSWFWKLLSEPGRIDFKDCSLKPPKEPSAPLATVTASSKKSAAPPLFGQLEIAL